MDKTIEQLSRFGAQVNGDYWQWNVYASDQWTVVSDGQVACWGTDDELADSLRDLPDDATFEQIWEALDSFPTNA